MKFYTHKTTSIFVTDVKFNKNPLFHLRDVQFFLSEQICCCKMLKGSLFLGHTVFAYCHIFCIFQSRAHIAYIFSAQNGIFDSNFNIICVSVTYFYLVANRMASSMCLDHPCGTRWGSWFQAILYHVSNTYLVFMRSAYFFNA